MKEQHLRLETFYPLDFIESPNLDECLREIREPKNTKLLVDVIKHNPPLIKKGSLKNKTQSKKSGRIRRLSSTRLVYWLKMLEILS